MYKTASYLKLKPMGIDMHQQLAVFMRSDCHVAKAEGFNAQARVEVRTKDASITATLVLVTDGLLSHEEAGLSDAAWRQLGKPIEGEKAWFRHAPPVESMSCVRGKLYGQRFTENSAQNIIQDIKAGRYSDIQMAAYVTACAGDRLDLDETIAITQAMIDSGKRFQWPFDKVMDKHCVGGLPGNRTTPIVVAIVAANGLHMPKTSSRAITSPAGTADTMEALTNVQLAFEQMQQVVEEQGACLAWGGSVSLSPTDDMIIRIERALDLDSEGQLVASVISKKVAAGAKQVLIDIPVGPTAKVRTHDMAEKLATILIETGKAVGLEVRTIITDGSQPIGHGIGPSLEAKDVLAVLKNSNSAPKDLLEKSLHLAAILLEMGEKAAYRQGYELAKKTLENGQALAKFKEICQAQGDWKTPEKAPYQHCIRSQRDGTVTYFNNRFISRLASLAGAPNNKTAGIELHVHLGETLSVGDPLITLHAEAPGELDYALEFYKGHEDMIRIEGEFE